MTRPVLRLGAPVLREAAKAVEAVTPEIQALVDDMIASMYAARGIGLAAPQIGVGLRIFVVDVSGGRDPAALKVCINPEWVRRDGMQLEEEGCLSVPGFNATVARPATASVRALGRDGQPHTLEGTGLLARALQHEMDHLDGMLFVDRLRGINRAMILRKIRKLDREGEW
ncbi:MAG: peptide deformylase [Vicinamibacterales bacterium]